MTSEEKRFGVAYGSGDGTVNVYVQADGKVQLTVKGSFTGTMTGVVLSPSEAGMLAALVEAAAAEGARRQ